MELNEIRKEAAKICLQFRKDNNRGRKELAAIADVSIRSIYNVENEVPVYDKTLIKVMQACGYDYTVEIVRNLKKSNEK